MSQEALAQPEFTKSYVSAVERGKARPSLKALAIMARRLDLPITDFLAIVPAVGDQPDIPAREKGFLYQLDQAAILLGSSRAADAVQALGGAATEYADSLPQFGPRTQYRLPLLRATAYLHLGDLPAARQELAAAGRLAQELGDAEEVERVRNAGGLVFAQQGMPGLALEQHEQCREAIRNGTVQDPSLRLAIYANLATDYWALNQADRAVGIYREAGPIVENVQKLARQAQTYAGLSQTYGTAQEIDRAAFYSTRALTLYETVGDMAIAAQMTLGLVGHAIAQQDYAEAERLLAQAQHLLEPTGDNLVLSTVYERYAALELERGALDRAADYATRSRKLSETAFKARDAKAGAAATETVRSYARSLRVAGLIEERAGRPAAADSLFEKAIKLGNQSIYDETISEVELIYADLLAARGDHERASAHYRAAVKNRQRRTPR